MGVIASLFYLGTQIRQNTRSVRASSYHALVTNLANVASDVGRDAAASDLFVRGQADLQALNPTEQRQFGLLLQSVFRNFENLFYHATQEMIDDVVWVGWKNRITRYFWQPGVQAWWPTWRDDCHPDFREFLENSTPPEGPAIYLPPSDSTDPAA
jgi:hypothetical protein